MKKLLFTLMFFLSFLTVKSQDLMNMKPTGFVNDYEKVFTPAQKDTLEKMLSDYEKLTSIEICLVTSVDFDFDSYDDELAEKWGVGKEKLDNGLLITFSKTQRSYSIRTGYGLEAFLPDAKLSQFKPDLRDRLASEDYFGGFKELINRIETELGSDGYDMLVKNKEIEDAKVEERLKDFLNKFLLVAAGIALLSGIIYLIYLAYKRRKKFLELKNEINKVLADIEGLKRYLNYGIHQKFVNELTSGVIKKLRDKDVNDETRSSMQLIYNNLLDYKQTVSRTDGSLGAIKRFKSDIEIYLMDNYPYCAEYLKVELNSILNDIKIDELKTGEYTKDRMNKLTGIVSSLEGKIKVFLAKTVKINSIVEDKMNIDKKMEELTNQNSEYIKNKAILSGAIIGKKYGSLVNIDFNELTSKMKNDVNESFVNLEGGDYESAMMKHGCYVTTLAILNGAFSAVSSLLNEYNNSVKYIDLNKDKIKNKVSEIELKVNKSGVSYPKRSKFAEIKNDITRFNISLKDDVISAATLLKTILKELDEVSSGINSDISSHNSSKSSTGTYNSGTYRSSGGSFGGFGGGSFGGGGVRGKF